MNASDFVTRGTDAAPQILRDADIDRRFRRTVIARVLAGMVGLQLALPVYAMTIGEPRQISRLFEPLRVDIPIEAEVINDDLRVRLIMKTEDDLAAGTGSPGLRQELVTDATGQRFLRVTTSTAIREPMMTLRVDLSGGGIQVRRDLTLLFDPPQTDVPSAAFVARISPDAIAPATRAAGTASEELTTDATPSEVPASAPKPSRRVASTPRAESTSPTPATNSARRASLPSGWRVTRPARVGESLDEIATRVRPSGDIPVASMAMLLRWLNPRAFDPHNGTLRVGAQMRFPGSDEIGEQLAAFMPGSSPSQVTAAAAPAAPVSSAPVSAASVASASAPPGLQWADRLSSSSTQLIAALASGAVPAASAAALPAAPAANVTVPDGTPIVAVAPVLAARPEGAPSTVGAPAAAAVATLPIPTIFPAWMIAMALGLSGGMLWLFGRVLQNTPEPGFARRPVRHAFARRAIAAPALVDQRTQRGDSPAVAVLLPNSEPVREELEAPTTFAGNERVARASRSSEPMRSAEWDPEHFDLSRLDLDDVASDRDAVKGNDLSAMTGRRSNTRRS